MDCKDCIHHAKRDGFIYCVLNHYFPQLLIIQAYGCIDFKEEKIDLFNWEKEEKSNG